MRDRKSKLLWWKKSCLLFLYKLIELKGCCHPYRQKPCPFPCTSFWRILQKPLCKGHLSAPAPSPGYVEKLYHVFFHTSSAGFNSISQHAIAYQLWRICFLPYKSSIADIKRTVYLFGLKSSSSQGIWMVMKKSGILSIPVLPCQQRTICHQLKIFLRHPGIKQQISQLPSKVLAVFVWGFVLLWAGFLLKNTLRFCWVFGTFLGLGWVFFQYHLVCS